MKVTITMIGSLKYYKDAYRKFYGLSRKEKVSKKDLAIWIAGLADADIE